MDRIWFEEYPVESEEKDLSWIFAYWRLIFITMNNPFYILERKQLNDLIPGAYHFLCVEKCHKPLAELNECTVNHFYRTTMGSVWNKIFHSMDDNRPYESEEDFIERNSLKRFNKETQEMEIVEVIDPAAREMWRQPAYFLHNFVEENVKDSISSTRCNKHLTEYQTCYQKAKDERMDNFIRLFDYGKTVCDPETYELEVCLDTNNANPGKCLKEARRVTECGAYSYIQTILLRAHFREHFNVLRHMKTFQVQDFLLRNTTQMHREYVRRMTNRKNYPTLSGDKSEEETRKEIRENVFQEYKRY